MGLIQHVVVLTFFSCANPINSSYETTEIKLIVGSFTEFLNNFLCFKSSQWDLDTSKFFQIGPD